MMGLGTLPYCGWSRVVLDFLSFRVLVNDAVAAMWPTELARSSLIRFELINPATGKSIYSLKLPLSTPTPCQLTWVEPGLSLVFRQREGSYQKRTTKLTDHDPSLRDGHVTGGVAETTLETLQQSSVMLVGSRWHS